MRPRDLNRASAVLAAVGDHPDLRTFPARLRALGLAVGLADQRARDARRASRLADAFAEQLGIDPEDVAGALERAGALRLHREAHALARALTLTVRASSPDRVRRTPPGAPEVGPPSPAASAAPPQDEIPHVGLGLGKLGPAGARQEAWAEHLRTLVRAGRAPGYRAAFERWCAGTPPTETRRVLRLRTASRLLCGLGTPSASEAGLSLHPVWGTPWVPGSSLKGAVCAWTAESRGADPAWRADGEHFRQMFGASSGAEGGCIDLLDAWWEPEPDATPWAIEAATAHHRGHGPPHGMASPVPTMFLAATGAFRAVIEGPSGWLDLAQALLVEAVEERGVGARTRAGYGRLVRDGEREADRLAREASEARGAERRQREALAREVAEAGPGAAAFALLDAAGCSLGAWLSGEGEAPGLSLDERTVRAAFRWLYERREARGLAQLPDPIGGWCRAEAADCAGSSPSGERRLTAADLDEAMARHQGRQGVDFDKLCLSLAGTFPAEQLPEIEAMLIERGARGGHLKRLRGA